MGHESPTVRHDAPLPAAVVAHVAACPLLWVATSGPDGPNVAPKEVWTVRADAVWVALLASPVTARNLTHDQQVCVAAVDLWTQRGHKLGGTGRVVDQLPPDVADELARRAGPAFTVRRALHVELAWWSRIVGPSQRLGTGRSDHDLVAESLITHLAQRLVHGTPPFPDGDDR